MFTIEAYLPDGTSSPEVLNVPTIQKVISLCQLLRRHGIRPRVYWPQQEIEFDLDYHVRLMGIGLQPTDF